MSFGEKFFSASHANLDCLPEAPGVFTLYEDGRLIFIGHADGAKHTIKSRLMDHKAGREDARTQLFDHYTREVTPNVVLRYRELMVQFARKYHRWPEGNAYACRVLDDVMPTVVQPADSGSIAA
jgi:hypothetical protein